MHRKSGFRDILDGLANTIAMDEIATDLGDKDIRTSSRTQNMDNGNPTLCDSFVDPLRPRFWTPTVTTGMGISLPNYARGFRYLSQKVGSQS